MTTKTWSRCAQCKTRHKPKMKAGKPTGQQRAVCDRCGSTEARWLVEQTNTIAGKTKRRYSTHATQAEAEARKLRIEAEAAGIATTIEPSAVPFATVATEWVESKVGLALNSRKAYRRWARMLADDPIGAKPIGSITKADLRLAYGRWLERWSLKSVEQLDSVIAGCLGEAHNEGLIPKNPSKGALRESVPKDRPAGEARRKAWTREEISRFIDEAQDDELYALWRTILATGLRRGEALGIQAGDVDLEARTIQIRRQVHHVSKTGEVTVGRPKNGRDHVAHFDAATGELLARQIVEAKALAFAAGKRDDDATYVFSLGGGLPINPTTATARFRRLAQKLGLPGIGVHGLRHSAATMLIEAGADLIEVADHLGHRDARVTASTYLHRSDEARRATADLLGVAVGTT